MRQRSLLIPFSGKDHVFSRRSVDGAIRMIVGPGRFS